MPLSRFLRGVRRTSLVVFSLAALAPPHEARADPEPLLNPSVHTDPRVGRFTRGEAVAYGLLSGVFSLGSIEVSALPYPTISAIAREPYFQYGSELLASAPLFGIDMGDAVGVAGVQTALIGGAIGARAAGAAYDFTARPYWLALEGLSLHQAVWATWATYRDARVQGLAGEWSASSKWAPLTGDQLVVAPLVPKNIARKAVYIPVSIVWGMGVLGAVGYLEKTPVSRTAARDALLGAVLSWDAGVTEEAMFRGFFYEELRMSLGPWPAHLLNAAAFAGAHVPGDLDRSGQDIAIGIAARSIFSVIADVAYDEGGLAASTALHALWDLALFEAGALIGQGPFRPSALLPAHATGAQPTPTLTLVSGTW
jgi:membrane protease YdiL (CAAX protease family)